MRRKFSLVKIPVFLTGIFQSSDSASELTINGEVLEICSNEITSQRKTAYDQMLLYHKMEETSAERREKRHCTALHCTAFETEIRAIKSLNHIQIERSTSKIMFQISNKT